jgi:hypothetical protein
MVIHNHHRYNLLLLPRGGIDAQRIACEDSLALGCPLQRFKRNLEGSLTIRADPKDCTVPVESVLKRPEWTWPVFAGVRSIGTKMIVLINRIVVLKNRRISLLPLRNAGFMRHIEHPF